MLSKYNITTKIDDKLVIYNTFTNGVLSLNQEYADAYNELVNNNKCLKKDLVNELQKGGMIVQDNLNELQKMMIINKISSYDSNSLSLTIAPTSACNFKCPYCYEKGIEYKTMTDETQNGVIDFLKKNYSNLKNLNICWYGGEPLLKLDIIENITQKIKMEFGEDLNYSAQIVTNGYYLTEENAKKLFDLDVKFAQITIDGAKESHDDRRILHNGNPTFDTIINNIKNSYKYMNIVVRMNIDKSNINNMYEILDCFEKNNLKNKISFYLAPVDNINESCNECMCININEFSEEEILFYEKAIERGFNCNRVPNSAILGCGAISFNSFVIDPSGIFYKCWDDIGREGKDVGNIKDGIKMNENLIKWLSFNPIHDNECEECKIFPVCYGGCANIYFEKGKKQCPTIKYNVTQVIELLNKMKKMG